MGFQKNPLFGQPDHDKELPFFVTCNNPNCKRMGKQQTLSRSKTSYGNAVSHAINCYGESDLIEQVMSIREARDAELGSPRKQLDLITAFQVKPTAQEKALDHWMRLVTIHNILITKLKDNAFCMFLSCKKISYDVFIDTMLELSMIVETKIGAEMRGRTGTIIHDGWSKFSKHYVCLLACYMVNKGKQLEAQMTLLSCTRLPHVKEEDGE
jgi:hypothetical protein